MSFAPHIKNELHRVKEATEAATPYDPTVATKVILKTKPTTPAEPQRTAVWDTNPWDRFDRKVVLAYTGNQDRIKLLQTEFARVGLNDVKIHWNFDNRFVQDLAFSQLPIVADKRMQNKVIFNNSYGHYSIIKSSYQLGCEHILVMEDDIRFLRTVELIEKSLSTLPNDFDIAMLDSLHIRHGVKNHSKLGDPVNNFWVSMRKDECATSAACYALNRNGMEALIELYERDTIRPSDHYFNWERLLSTQAAIHNVYIAVPKVARQTLVGKSMTNTQYDYWSQSYENTAPRKDYGK